MGFGVSNLINKYVRPALISWDSYNGVEAGSLNVDVKVSETHKLNNNVTMQTMEDGSIIDEHIINSPFELTIQFEETNNTPLTGIIGSASAQTFMGKKWGPLSTFEKLTQLSNNKVPLTITTQHAIYENMIMKNTPIMHRAPYRNALQVSCDLIQLNFSKIQTFSYKSSNTGTNKSASSNVNGGAQSTSTFGG